MTEVQATVAAHPRARELIAALELRPHPEGGFYRETFRSSVQVASGEGRSRSALTTIYFLLAAGQFSAWHRVSSDEVWHWYEGDELELLLASPDFSVMQRVRLGRVGQGCEPAMTVPAGWWQAAQPFGSYTLAGCSVAPGFTFEDFSFLRADATAVALLRSIRPELASLL